MNTSSTINFEPLNNKKHKGTFFKDLFTILGWAILPFVLLAIAGTFIKSEIYMNVAAGLIVSLACVGFIIVILRALKHRKNFIADSRSSIEQFALTNGWSYYTLPVDYKKGNATDFIPEELRREENMAGNALFVVEGEINGAYFRFTPIEGAVNPTIGPPRFTHITILRVDNQYENSGPSSKDVLRYKDEKYVYYVVVYSAVREGEVRNLFSAAGLA